MSSHPACRQWRSFATNSGCATLGRLWTGKATRMHWPVSIGSDYKPSCSLIVYCFRKPRALQSDSLIMTLIFHHENERLLHR